MAIQLSGSPWGQAFRGYVNLQTKEEDVQPGLAVYYDSNGRITTDSSQGGPRAGVVIRNNKDGTVMVQLQQSRREAMALISNEDFDRIAKIIDRRCVICGKTAKMEAFRNSFTGISGLRFYCHGNTDEVEISEAQVAVPRVLRGLRPFQRRVNQTEPDPAQGKEPICRRCNTRVEAQASANYSASEWCIVYRCHGKEERRVVTDYKVQEAGGLANYMATSMPFENDRIEAERELVKRAAKLAADNPVTPAAGAPSRNLQAFVNDIIEKMKNGFKVSTEEAEVLKKLEEDRRAWERMKQSNDFLDAEKMAAVTAASLSLTPPQLTREDMESAIREMAKYPPPSSIGLSMSFSGFNDPYMGVEWSEEDVPEKKKEPQQTYRLPEAGERNITFED